MFRPTKTMLTKRVDLFINVLQYCIWPMRNLYKHEFKNVTTLSIKAMFILTLRIKAEFPNLDK